jgi:serine/threonine-protein kinase
LLHRIDAELQADSRFIDASATVLPLPVELRYDDLVLMSFVGQGGMGKVYRALHKSSGRFVAVKALRKDRQTDPVAVASFIREAAIVADLNHAHIVSVVGTGRFPSGGRFIVFDLIEGTDLESRIAAGDLSVESAMRIAAEVAEAVDFAHAKGVVHGDLKPANVLLDDAERAYVADFGFAQLLAAPSPQIIRGVGGTRCYMAPEVQDGCYSPTPAIDVYGLGAVLFTMLTAKQPDADVIGAHRDAALHPEACTGPLALALSCLCREAAGRPPSAAAVAQTLRSLG